MTIDQVNREVERLLTDAIARQAAALDPAVPAILACHVSLNDFLVEKNRGSELWMTVGTVPTLLKSNLHEGQFDYIALGHHHNNLDLRMRTPCWYAGSMQPVDFGEADQPKGFMVLDIEPGAVLGARINGAGLPRLVEVPARRFVTVECRPKEDDPTPEVCRSLDRAPVAGAVVRVQVHLSREQAGLLRVPEVRRLLEPAHYVAHVRMFLPDDSRAALPAGVQPDAASPLQALEDYLKLKDYEERRREQLLASARDLVATVDETLEFPDA